MASQNIDIVFKRKSISSNPGASAMSYSPSSHTMPAIFQHRDSFVHQRELESAFCSDLVCCGIHIKDLHELLHHYEELHHAPIEEEEEQSTTTSSTTKEERSSSSVGGEEEADNEDVAVVERNQITYPLPTQPHELAALSPRLKSLYTNSNQPNPAILIQQQQQQQQQQHILQQQLQSHTEDILKQALPALMTHPGSTTSEPIQYFSSEALYQTCVDDGTDKPYKCPIPGCDKAYKNPNGLKYHQMHGHTEDDPMSDAERDAQRPYMCTIGYCNKRYKNLNGLKYHIEHSHIAKLKQQNDWSSSPPPPSLPPSATF